MPMEQPCLISICLVLRWGTTRYIVIPWNYTPFSLQKLLVSQNLDYCSRKLTHFLKYPTVRVKIIPSSLKFTSLCRENKAFNFSLIAWKIRSVYQFSANQKEWNKTNSLQAVKQLGSFERSKNHGSPMLTMYPLENGHVARENREKLPHGIMGRLHNPPLVMCFCTA